jgi:hypothetical protein
MLQLRTVSVATWWAWLWGVMAVALIVLAFFVPFWLWALCVFFGFGTMEGIGVAGVSSALPPLTDVIHDYVPAWVAIPAIWGLMVGGICSWLHSPHPVALPLFAAGLGWFNTHFIGKYFIGK